MQNSKANQVLKHYWGYDAFRSLQEDIIESVLDKKDTLALLPTGGGKSICFQVPALLMDGVCIVISPLIALMKDQVHQLKKRGIRAAAIYSGMNYREIDIVLENTVQQAYKFLYVSPERLKTEIFQERAKRMKISLLAIDEAHCISQWGYDFRPPYLEISDFRAFIPSTPCIALTATATPSVQQDIKEKLNFHEGSNHFQKSFARENLSYSVREVENKESKLLEILAKVTGSSVVYARNRKTCQDLAKILLQNGFSADFYHAGLQQDERSRKQEDWINGKIRIIVSTNAFGMGIDKANVRSVVHWDLPDTMESYYQEAGRAGRDGFTAFAVALFHKKDLTELRRRVEQANPSVEFIKKIYQHIANYYKIAIGSGEMVSYEFHIADFSKQYNVPALEVYHSLKILEEEGFIQLNEQFYSPSSIQITLSYKELYSFEIANAKFEPTIKAILRIYGGEIYQQPIFVDEKQIANTANLNSRELNQQLRYLQSQGVLEYREKSDSPRITFLQGRYDASKLPLNTVYLEERKKLKINQIESMIQYVQNSDLCRTVQILRYFGEDYPDSCGVCDVCIRRKPKQASKEYSLSQDILNQLKQGAMHYNSIAELFPNFSKDYIIKVLRYMDEQGLISLDANGIVVRESK